ncbi:hypothetical protein GALL_375650 [mine drainage metagenome]|uniref:Uncharacterized protein n=1 Tax=mine drainage metagenome TaxID=410659 RepID=A0A1J5QL29_9ZZZZ
MGDPAFELPRGVFLAAKDEVKQPRQVDVVCLLRSTQGVDGVQFLDVIRINVGVDRLAGIAHFQRLAHVLGAEQDFALCIDLQPHRQLVVEEGAPGVERHVRRHNGIGHSTAQQ